MSKSKPKKVKKGKSPRNPFEKRLEQQIRQSGLQYEYESVKLPFSYTIQGNYSPDFVITKPDGSRIFIEGKGQFRPEAMRKMIAAKENDPTLDIRLVFYCKAHWKQGQRHSTFCKKYGFPCAFEGNIPPEWLQVNG